MEVDGISMPMLDGTNYRQWKLRMRCILEAKDLDQIVYGTACQPATGTERATSSETAPSATADDKSSLPIPLPPSEDEKTFKQLEARAKMILVCSVDSKHTTLIESCRTARDIWNRLATEYSDKEPMSLDNILIEYYTFKKDPTKGVSDYIAQIETYASKLAELGRELPEHSIMAKIVAGLPPEYAAFRRSWDMTPPQFKSKDLLITNLKKEEKCLQTSGMVNEALVARSNPARGNQFKKINQTDIQAKKKKTTCGWCKETGHWWKECPKRPADQIPENSKRSGNRGRNSSTKKHQQPQQQQHQSFDRALSAVSGDTAEDTWFLDSAASFHMTGRKDWFSSLNPLAESEPVRVGNGGYLYAIAMGTINATAMVDGLAHSIPIINVRYVPHLTDNLLSVGQMDDLNVKVEFQNGKVAILDDNGIFTTGRKITSKLYKLDLVMPKKVMIARAERTLEEWHSVLGHADINQIKQMAKSGCVAGMKIVERPRRDLEGCTDCQLGKGHCASHPSSHRPRATSILERVHMDLVGPISPPSLGGMNYFLLIKDEFSTYMFAEFVNSKAHVPFSIRKFVNYVSTLTQARVKTIRTDNGTEFKNQGMTIFCANEGIHQEFSAPRTPEQNGEAERANRTIIETARSMLLNSRLPLNLWAEAVNTAVYVRNRTKNSRTDNKTPFEMFYGRIPDLSYLVKFGQQVHVIDHDKRLSKFSPKTKEAFVVGYASRANTYRCLLRDSKEVFITSDVVPAAHTRLDQRVDGTISSCITFMIERQSNNADKATESSSPVQSCSGIDLQEVSEDDARRHCTNEEPLHGEDDEQLPSPTAMPETPDYTRSTRTESTGTRSQMYAIPEIPARSSSLQPDRAPEINLSKQRSVSWQIPHAQNIPAKGSGIDDSPQRHQVHSHTPHPVTAAMSIPLSSSVLSVPKSTVNQTVSASHAGQARAAGLSPSAIVSRLSNAINRPRRTNVKSTFMRSNIAQSTARFEPQSYAEALASSDSSHWTTAIESELSAHSKNGTWVTVPKFDGLKEITAKWIFKLKQDGDAPARYKARLVARGFSQVKGVDYSEIFSPVVRMDSIRLLFALCAQYDLEFAQFDITTAFLNGEVKEELYIEPPEGLQVPEGHTCRLLRSLYGLKQAPRCWHEKFTQMLKLFNMEQTYSDSCVFVGTDPELIYLALYVDDGLVFAKKPSTIERLIRYLTKHFEVKVLNSRCFLGLEIERDREEGKILLHQQRYIERILTRFNMAESKPAVTPLETGHTLNKPELMEQEPLEGVPYAEALGSLMYCGATRPDLAHALSVLSKYTKSHRRQHWEAIKRSFRYLKGTSDFGLLYQQVEDPLLVCYTDADWAGDQTSRRSMSGMLTTIGSGPISFKARQQSVVAQSTAEAEYMAAGFAVQELIWLSRFLNELKVPITGKPLLLCDNQSALKLIKNPENHERTKHIDIKFHYIREVYQDNKFDIDYIATEKQIADIFTKALSSPKHNALRDAIGCVSKRNIV